MQPNTKERGIWTSASNAESDLLCPGRHNAQIGIPEQPQSEDAASGTRIHKALANALDPKELTPDEVETYERCRELETKVIQQFFGQAIPKLIREERFWVRYGEVEHSGQADLVARAGVKALVIDYKTGRNEVAESPSNLQLRDLAVLVSHGLVVDTVGTAIIQPWATMEPTICVYERAELDRASAEMFQRVFNSNAPNPLRVAGPVQCRYCRAKGVCQEYQIWAGATVPVPRSIVDLPMHQWTLEQRAVAADNLERAQQWLDLVKDQLKVWLRADPASVPGWALKDGAVRETIKDPQAVFERFTNLGGKLEQYLQTVTIGKTKLKAQLKEATGLKGGALDKKLADLIDGLVTESQNSPSLIKVKP